MNSLFLGLGTVIIASVFQGSFAVPMAYARTWKWENQWMIFSIFGMIVFNLLFAVVSIPNLFEVYRIAPSAELFLPLVFGIIWGIGAISFGLGITTVGFALGYPIMLGTVTGMGTFIPMVILYPAEILTARGLLVVIGLLINLTGIGLSGYAGIRKGREQGKIAGEITRNARFSVKTGILICLASGMCSSTINIGFSMSGKLVEVAQDLGASENLAGNVIWVILFTSGGILNILYCAYLMGVNKTTKYYKTQGSLKNFLFLLLMSVMWIGSFILYGAGATMMGSWGTVIGWPVYMVLSIAFANIWGIFHGEWRGVSSGTKIIMVQALCILLCAIVIFAYSGTV
ncbi:L-rhamnose/proton symporter RhaT [Candidatus Latescibacterota bacterium]